MHHQRCVCPNCGITLRVKDRSFLGRPIPCPDCRSRLIFTSPDGDQLQVVLVDTPPLVKSGESTRETASAAAGMGRSAKLRAAGWGAALLTAGLVAVLGWRSRPAALPLVAEAQPEAGIGEQGDSPPVGTINDEADPAPADEMPTISFESSHDVARKNDAEPEPAEESGTATAQGSDPSETSPNDEPAVMPEAKAPVVVAEPPPFDFDKAFAQPLQRFRQAESISRSELLELLSELLGAPIRYDQDQLGGLAGALDQKVSLDLSDTTVGKVLDTILEKTGIVYERERDGLRLRPAEGAASKPGERTL